MWVLRADAAALRRDGKTVSEAGVIEKTGTLEGFLFIVTWIYVLATAAQVSIKAQRNCRSTDLLGAS